MLSIEGQVLRPFRRCFVLRQRRLALELAYPDELVLLSVDPRAEHANAILRTGGHDPVVEMLDPRVQHAVVDRIDANLSDHLTMVTHARQRPHPASALSRRVSCRGELIAETRARLDRDELGVDTADRGAERTDQLVECGQLHAGRVIGTPHGPCALLARANLAPPLVQMEEQSELVWSQFQRLLADEEAHGELVVHEPAGSFRRGIRICEREVTTLFAKTDEIVVRQHVRLTDTTPIDIGAVATAEITQLVAGASALDSGVDTRDGRIWHDHVTGRAASERAGTIIEAKLCRPSIG